MIEYCPGCGAYFGRHSYGYFNCPHCDEEWVSIDEGDEE